MGFVRNGLNYPTHEEITKQSYSLRDTSGSSRGYFPDLQLWLVLQISKFVERDQIGDSVSYSPERILCINM